MSVSSQTVISPSWRLSFSISSAGFCTYSLVWPSKPRSHCQPRSGLAGLLDRAGEDHAEERAHGAARQRIADQDLPLPARRQQVVPVGRRLLALHGLRVVDQHRRGAVGAEVEVAGGAAGRRHRAGPARAVGRQQPLGGAAGEDRLRTAEPDVRLRVGGLGADAVVDLLRAHVEPADVDVRVLGLEALLHQEQQVAAVRGVDDQRDPAVAAARGESGQEDRGRSRNGG